MTTAGKLPCMSTKPPCVWGTGAFPFLGTASLPGIEDILLFVDKAAVTGSEDGTRQNPFHTIADALTAAAALTPGAARKVTLLIYPGEYSEDGLNSVDYVNWVGVGGRDAVRIEGDDATVLTVDDEHTSYWGITFAQTDGAQYSVDVNGAAGDTVEFHECAFENTSSGPCFNINGNSVVRAKDCVFSTDTDQAAIVGAYQNDNSELYLEGCRVVGFVYYAAHATSGLTAVLSVKDCRITSSNAVAASGSITTTVRDGNWRVESSYIQNTAGHCIRIYNYFGILRNNKLQCNSGWYDVYAGGAVAGNVIEGNVMTYGIHSNVSHIKAERNVGASGDMDFYATLDEALDSITFDGIVVRMLKDETVSATINYTATYDFVLDGMDHTLSYGVLNLADWTVNAVVVIRRLRFEGYWFTRPGAAPNGITFEDCESAGTVDIASGSTGHVKVIRSKIVGAASIATAALGIRTASPEVVIEDSYLKGGTAAAAAVSFITATNNNLKIRRSKVFHGGLGANNPFTRTGAQTPNWRGYQNEFNADPDSFGWSTNLVAAGQQQTSFDVNTDFF